MTGLWQKRREQRCQQSSTRHAPEKICPENKWDKKSLCNEKSVWNGHPKNLQVAHLTQAERSFEFRTKEPQRTKLLLSIEKVAICREFSLAQGLNVQCALWHPQLAEALWKALEQKRSGIKGKNIYITLLRVVRYEKYKHGKQREALWLCVFPPPLCLDEETRRASWIGIYSWQLRYRLSSSLSGDAG